MTPGARAPGISFGDRIVCAFASSILMAVTLVTGALIIAVLTVLMGVGDPSPTRRPATHFFGLVYFLDSFLIWLFAAVCLSTAALGFILGTERMVRVWGVIWQTEKPTRTEFVVAALVISGIVVAMFSYGLRKLGVL
jgi:hypothetical protein